MIFAWFESDDDESQRQQRWFIHVAQGGNIRQMDTPIRLTKRMAHLFLRAPGNDTVLRSLRWAQVLGLGGDEPLARAILRTRLGRRFDDDDFWSGVVLFLVNNAMLDPTWAGPVVDYIYNMKYASRRIVQEGGGIVEGPPPQPGLTMKGRSATKLLRQVEAWHGDLSREHYVERRNVLTVAVDTRERAVTQARGRHNALPHRRPKSAQLRRQPGSWTC